MAWLLDPTLTSLFGTFHGIHSFLQLVHQVLELFQHEPEINLLTSPIERMKNTENTFAGFTVDIPEL